MPIVLPDAGWWYVNDIGGTDGDGLALTAANGANDFNPGTSPFSFCALVTLKSGAQGYRRIVAKTLDGIGQQSFDLMTVESNQSLRCRCWRPSGTEYGFYTPAVFPAYPGPSSSKYLCCFTWTPGTMTGYVCRPTGEGPTVTNSGATDVAIADSTSPLAIGQTGAGSGAMYDSNIYWFAFWMGEAKSQSFFEDLYNQVTMPYDTSPLCYVDFHQAVGSTYDSEIPTDSDYVFDVINTPVHEGSSDPTFEEPIGLVAPMLVRHAGLPEAPIVLSATPVDSTHVDITFDQEMIHVDAGGAYDALNPSNYTFSVVGGANISSVASVYKEGTSGKEYRIETTEQTDGADYTIYSNNVRSKLNESIDTLNNAADFEGFGERPAVESAVADSYSQVTVVFDELMNHDSALETAGNYDISGPTVVAVTSVAATDWPDDKTRSVCQLSGEMTTDEIYTMEVTGVSDTAENPILGNPDNQASFLGVGDHPRVNSSGIPVVGGQACKIIFSELMASQVLIPGNYTLEGPPGTFLNVTNVMNVDDDYTYQLTTEQQTAGVEYTVTVSSNVKDLYQNEVLAPYNEATFTGAGYSPPDVTMNPSDGSTEVDIRRKLLITAKDPTTEFTGINKSTWWTRLTYTREGAPMELVQYAIKDGEIQSGYEGGVFRGSELDQDVGLTMWVRPLSKKWLEETEYQVETYVEDREFIPNENLVTGTFTTGVSTCFEDSLPRATTTDTLLSTPLTDYPNCERLRRMITEFGTASTTNLVRARTLLHLATITDLKTILAGRVDYSLVDNIRLCDRLPVLDVYNKIVKYPRIVKDAIDEIPSITNEAKAAIMQQLRSNSAVYVVNAAAIAVVLCVLMSNEE